MIENREKKNRLGGLCLLLILLFTACSPTGVAVEPTSTPPGAMQLPADTPTEAANPTSEIQSVTPPSEETSQPDDQGNWQIETEEAAENVSACVECHTDQAMLIDTADPVEEVKSENEGAG